MDNKDNIRFSEGLFENVPVDVREKFIKNVLEKAGEKFFVYGCETFDFEPGAYLDQDDPNTSYQLIRAKICKTKADNLFQVDSEVVFHVDINKRKIVHADFKFKDSLVFFVDDVMTNPVDWYEHGVGADLRLKRKDEFDAEQNEENKIYAPKTKKYVKIPEISEPTLEELDGTSTIVIGLKSDFSRIKSFVYANMRNIRKLSVFKEMRILEFEDEMDYSDDLKQALDYVLHMLKSPKYRIDPKSCCKVAAEKYKLNVDDVIKGNQTRVNIRNACKKVWTNHRK